MASRPDKQARLSASRVCAITGVRPQTRDTWVKRGLLRSADQHGELDVIEQAVVKVLLSTVPKSHVDLVWHELRPRLWSTLIHRRMAVVWDPQARRVTVASDDTELADAVRHGRPVQVVPVGDVVAEARRVYRVEAEAAARSAAARSDSRRAANRPQRREARGPDTPA